MKRRTRTYIEKAKWGTTAQSAEYSIIEYIVGDGPPDDPGSTIARRIAVYRKEEVPEDFQAALTTAMENSRWGFEGMEDTLADEQIEIVQEGDHDANDHREAEARLGDGNIPYSWREGSNGVSYEQFLTAIDALAVDDQDEEAYKVIDTWRQRQLRHDERG